MKKLLGTAILVALALAALCGWDMYRTAKADLKAYRAKVDTLQADNAIKQTALDKAAVTIAEAQGSAASARSDAQAKGAEITLLKRELAAVVGQEPPTTPEVESLPIVINLRAQVARLSEMFTLSEARAADLERVIVSKDTIIAAQAEAMVSLKAQRDNYKALWETADALVTKRARLTLKQKITWTAIGAGAGVLGHSILHRRQP